jgi:hypothetical protein
VRAPSPTSVAQAKYNFIREATLNGFIGLGHQTDRVGGEHIVRCAVAAWEELERIRLAAQAVEDPA